MFNDRRKSLTLCCAMALASGLFVASCAHTPVSSASGESPAIPTPVGKSGVQGQVLRLEGDFMPPTDNKQGTRTPLQCRVFVFRGKVKPFAQPDSNHPSIAAVVNSDSSGHYAAELPPGVYTAVAELEGKLYYNGIDSDGNWASFTVKPGQLADWPIIDNSRATY